MAIFSFFIVVATILWYLNKLSNEYTTDLQFPLRIINQPKGKIIVGEPVEKLTLRVNAFGYYLLRYKISASLIPITIDLNEVLLLPYKKSSSHFYILSTRLRSTIVSQIGGEFRLEAVLPDTLFFEFTSLEEKKVKVLPKVVTTFEKQYMQSGPVVVSPDSITLSGPKSILDTINHVETLPVKGDRLYSDLEVTGSLPPIKQVAFSHRRVSIVVPVEKFTEATISLPIEVKNKPDNIEVKLIPSTVNFKCNVVLSRYNNLNNRYFTAQVDYFAIDWSSTNKLRVNITRMPDFITKFDFEPKYVEYIIEKK